MRRRPLAVQAAVLVACLLSPARAAEPAARIGFRGYDRVAIGMPLWDLLVVLGEHVTVESVEGGCAHVYASSPVPPELLFMVVDGALARIEVRTPGIATISGVAVGDAESDVFAAYPDRVEVSDHEYQAGHYLTVYSTDRRSALVFDTDGATIRSFRIGRLPEALWVEGCS